MVSDSVYTVYPVVGLCGYLLYHNIISLLLGYLGGRGMQP